MILASRTLGPINFGIFSVSIAIMGIISKGVDLGVNQLIPRYFNRWVNDTQKLHLFLGQLLSWKLKLVIATIFVSLSAIPFASKFLNYPYPSMMLWSILGALIVGAYEYVYLISSANHKFLDVSKMSIIQSLIKLFGFLAATIISFDTLNLIAGVYFLAPLFGLIYVALRLKTYLWTPPKSAPNNIRMEMYNYFKHAFFGVVAATLISNMDVLFVQKYLNAFDTGLYAGASRIATFVIFGVSAVGGVLNNRVSRYHDAENLKKYLIKSLSIVAISIIGFLLYLPFAGISLIFTIGPEYISGLPSLIILVLNAFICLAVVPYTSFFYAVNHPKYFSFGGILQVLILFIGNVVFLPRYGIQAAAWVKTSASMAFAIFTLAYVWYAWRGISKKTIANKNEISTFSLSNHSDL